MSYYQYLDEPSVREYYGVGELGSLLVQSSSHETINRIINALPQAFKDNKYLTPLHSLVHFYRQVGTSNYFKVAEYADDHAVDDVAKYINTIIGDHSNIKQLVKDTSYLA